MSDVVKFKLGQIVYSPIDRNARGLVTGIIYRSGCVEYFVAWAAGATDSVCQDIELSCEQLSFEPA
jgi:hypothetical protein